MDLAKFTPQIADAVEQLRTKGLTAEHRKILPARFKWLWIESSTSSQSKWRNDTARRAFRDVQDKSAHLFFVLILLVTPTQCGRRAFCNVVITPLLDLESYDPYFFSLTPQNQRFLEDMAKANGFAEEPGFVALMQALFPEAGNRTITYAYSKLPRSNLPLFLRVLAEAIEKSNLYLGETERGDEETSAATVLIPAGYVDCACSITVSRPVITEALKDLRFQKIYEELAPFSN